MGRQRLRWEGNIRRDCSLRLNIRGWWRLAGDSDIWGPTIEKSEPDVGCLPEKKKKKKKKKKKGRKCFIQMSRDHQVYKDFLILGA